MFYAWKNFFLIPFFTTSRYRLQLLMYLAYKYCRKYLPDSYFPAIDFAVESRIVFLKRLDSENKSTLLENYFVLFKLSLPVFETIYDFIYICILSHSEHQNRMYRGEIVYLR